MNTIDPQQRANPTQTISIGEPAPTQGGRTDFSTLLEPLLKLGEGTTGPTTERSQGMFDSGHAGARRTESREDLVELLSMSPAERIRYTMLKDMGLTEETLANLPYDLRMRIERMIEQEIERQLGGVEGDVSESNQDVASNNR
ncbi:hypothetical protein [Marinobacterium litorale]|uniref:hypothetical protein n=1 Tax=Marinobacterium litorale TaxID=404770 RepID=UPI00040A567D|nr:hypothetical protein [Marinobacterium litorale]